MEKLKELTSAVDHCQKYERKLPKKEERKGKAMPVYSSVTLLELQRMIVTDKNEHTVVAVRNMFSEFSR